MSTTDTLNSGTHDAPFQSYEPYQYQPVTSAYPSVPISIAPSIAPSIPVAHPVHRLVGTFSDGIFDCCSQMETCCLGCWFSPMLYARNAVKAIAADYNASFATYFVPWLLVFLFTLLSPLISGWTGFLVIPFLSLVTMGTILRGKIRAKFSIEGSKLKDCCAHFWCMCCSLTQESRHLDRDGGILI